MGEEAPPKYYGYEENLVSKLSIIQNIVCTEHLFPKGQ